MNVFFFMGNVCASKEPNGTRRTNWYDCNLASPRRNLRESAINLTSSDYYIYREDCTHGSREMTTQ